MNVTAQYAPFLLNLALLLITVALLVRRVNQRPCGKILVSFRVFENTSQPKTQICVYSFVGVPIELMTFAMQLYFCKCPWVDVYYARRLQGYRPQYRTNLHTPRSGELSGLRLRLRLRGALGENARESRKIQKHN